MTLIASVTIRADGVRLGVRSLGSDADAEMSAFKALATSACAHLGFDRATSDLIMAIKADLDSMRADIPEGAGRGTAATCPCPGCGKVR